ncbi:MAG: imelysin family protein [Bacteroidia bacterium]|nr:imelysin family protein [Bacteroidia bacterium]
MGWGLSGLLSLIFFSCSDDSRSAPDTFNREAMLQNIAENLIRPNLADLQSRVNTLNHATSTFTTTPNQANLDALQSAWETAYTSWQHVSMFNFGPGNRALGPLVQVLGTFPVDTTGIEAKITAQDFDLSDDFALDIRGFLALEYLIFNPKGDADVLANYQGTADARKAYLLELMENIKAEADAVQSQWLSYVSTFISQNGTDVGSSASLLFNNLSESYEAAKNFKVGLPAGKRPGQTAPTPERVEAYYSGKSRTFLLEHLAALENLWSGRSRSGNDGLGFEEYLMSVEGGTTLVTNTKAQLATVKAAINALPDGPLSETIISNFQLVDQTHTEMQKHTRFFKSDMASLLGLTITFNSGDGD